MIPVAVLIFLIFVVIIILSSSIKIVREYERAVIFRLGRLLGAKGPGIFFRIPIFDSLIKVDLRTITFNVPPQEVVTKDNVTTKVDAVVYYRVIDPEKAITQVENYHLATSQMAVTTLRSVIGQSELDELLSHRDKLNAEIQRIVDETTEPWGVKITAVEIKDVVLPEGMQRAMAAQAEAERHRRAKIIEADGEYQAATKLAEAAKILSETPGAMYVRMLRAISDITKEKANVVIFPLPIEILEALGYRKS